MSWRWDGKSWVGWHMEATVPLAKPNCSRSSRTILDNSSWGWKFSYQVKAAHFWKPCNEEEEESGKNPEPLP